MRRRETSRKTAGLFALRASPLKRAKEPVRCLDGYVKEPVRCLGGYVAAAQARTSQALGELFEEAHVVFEQQADVVYAEHQRRHAINA